MTGRARQRYTFVDYLALEAISPVKHVYLDAQVWAMAGGTPEVLSPSTETYDRGEKLAHYKRIPSLQEILLVGQDERLIERWSKSADGWTLEVVRGEGRLRLQSVECTLELAEVYPKRLDE